MKMTVIISLFVSFVLIIMQPFKVFKFLKMMNFKTLGL